MGKSAVYAGSFDPVTYGHIDVIERALSVFDRLIVAVYERKPQSRFSCEKRIELLNESFGVSCKRVLRFVPLVVCW